METDLGQATHSEIVGFSPTVTTTTLLACLISMCYRDQQTNKGKEGWVTYCCK